MINCYMISAVAVVFQLLLDWDRLMDRLTHFCPLLLCVFLRICVKCYHIILNQKLKFYFKACCYECCKMLLSLDLPKLLQRVQVGQECC